jgi:hypothetical protein
MHDGERAMDLETAGCPTFMHRAPPENEPVSITLMVSSAVERSIEVMPRRKGS